MTGRGRPVVATPSGSPGRPRSPPPGVWHLSGSGGTTVAPTIPPPPPSRQKDLSLNLGSPCFGPRPAPGTATVGLRTKPLNTKTSHSHPGTLRPPPTVHPDTLRQSLFWRVDSNPVLLTLPGWSLLLPRPPRALSANGLRHCRSQSETGRRGGSLNFGSPGSSRPPGPCRRRGSPGEDVGENDPETNPSPSH